ncbi:hypothetical protein N7470_008795 [Penicillium chermesinum]|nr:hypothetical protein N7470_008795 [Penicillium chermesinum]
MGADSKAQEASKDKEAVTEPPPAYEAESGPMVKPFPAPLESCKPPKPAELTADQKSKYDAVLKTVSSWETVPTKAGKNAPTEPITDDERMWLTRECLLRYLRATKWNVSEAQTRLLDTLTWRREYNIKKLTPDYISVENATGKQIIAGYDIHGRPCHYLLPSRQNTEKSDRQVEHLVYMLERDIELMGPNQETIALIINFNETKSGQNASIAQAKETLNILQNHYPERLGVRSLSTVSLVPWVIWGFFKLITPFIDPLTREKIKFNEDLRKHQLLNTVGGDVEFKYDHSVYWPTLNAMAAERREAYRQRWVDGGKLVGEFENYLKGENIPSLAQTQVANGDGAAST